MEKITAILIYHRAEPQKARRVSGKVIHTIVWMTTGAVCWLGAYAVSTDHAAAIMLSITASICIMLSAVDIVIKKIPNPLLLALAGVGAINIAVERHFFEWNEHVIGAVLGFLVFLLPALIGKGAGLGDVKFASIVGLFLGTYDFFIVILVMTLFLLVYTGYLIAKGKGGLKTKVALGPFLASGFIILLTYQTVMDQSCFIALIQAINSFVF